MKTEAEKAFLQTRRYFGLGAFLECWDRFVVPLRNNVNLLTAKYDELMNHYEKRTDEVLDLRGKLHQLREEDRVLTAELAQAKREVEGLRTANDLLKKGNVARQQAREKEENESKYVVELIDGYKDERPYAVIKCFPEYYRARLDYEAKRANLTPTSLDSELTLLKMVRIKQVKAKRVPKK